MFLIQVPIAAPLVFPGQPALIPGQSVRRVLLKIQGSQGLAGWSEVSLGRGWLNAADTLAAMAKAMIPTALVGCAAWNIDAALTALQRVLPPGSENLVAAAEMALHDLVARSLRIPIHVLLGGKRTEGIPLVWTVASADSDDAVRQVQAGSKAGHTAFKIELGQTDLAKDRKILEAVTATAPLGSLLWVDGNQAYTWEVAQRQAKFLADFDVRVFAQPVAGLSPSTYRRLGAHPSVPLAVDDALDGTAPLWELLRADVLDYLILRPGRWGYRLAREMASLASLANVTLLGNCGWDTELGIAHALQLLNALPWEIPCAIPGRRIYAPELFHHVRGLQKSRVVLRDYPGCGVDVDNAKLREWTVK